MIDIEAKRLEGPILEWAFWVLVALCVLSAIFWWTIGLGFLVGLSLLGVLVLLYGGFVAPRRLQVKTYRLPLVADPQTWVRVAFFSDLHAGEHKGPDFYAQVVSRIMGQKPDLILLGGDLVEEVAATVKALLPLKKLHAPMGKFFILGNHDFADDPDSVRRQLIVWGFDDVTNAVRHLEKDGRMLNLVALEDAFLGHPKLDLLHVPQAQPRLLLLHEPDNLFDVEAGDAEVVLVGHTHGGQIRLPFIGALRRLPQEAPQWLDRGLKYWKEIPVVISQGIGESSSRARLFCPPQIVIVELGI